MTGVLTLSSPVVSAQPGAEATVTLSVRNTGTVVEAYAFDVVGPVSAWATVEPLTLNLYPAAEGTALLRIRVPAESSAAAGAMPFGVRLRSLTQADESSVEEGTLHVAGASALTGRMVPTTSESPRKAVHRVELTNSGNVPLAVALRADDPDAHLELEIAPAYLQLPPGGTAHTTLKVRAYNKLKSGIRRRAFTVYAEAPGAPPLRLDGALEQQSSGLGLGPKLAIAAGAVAVLAAVAIVTLTRGDDHDTNTVAGTFTPPPASSPAGGGAGGGGGGGKPSDKPSSIAGGGGVGTATGSPVVTLPPTDLGEALPGKEWHSSPDVLRVDDLTEIYLRGTDDTIYRMLRPDGGEWTEPVQITTTPVASSVAVAAWSSGRRDILVRGKDDKLYDVVLTEESKNPPALVDPSGTGGIEMSGSPDVSSRHEGHLDVVYRGTDNLLYHVWQDGGAWMPPEQIGGPTPIDFNPAIISLDNTRSDVFVASAEGALLRTTWREGVGWSALAPLGDPPNVNSGVDAAHAADPARPATLTACYRTPTKTLACRTAPDGETFGPPSDAGGSSNGDPAVAWSTPTQLDLFYWDTEHSLRHKVFNGSTWH